MPESRFNLLRQVNRLARNLTRWTEERDKRLHHLMPHPPYKALAVIGVGAFKDVHLVLMLTRMCCRIAIDLQWSHDAAVNTAVRLLGLPSMTLLEKIFKAPNFGTFEANKAMISVVPCVAWKEGMLFPSRTRIL